MTKFALNVFSAKLAMGLTLREGGTPTTRGQLCRVGSLGGKTVPSRSSVPNGWLLVALKTWAARFHRDTQTRWALLFAAITCLGAE